MRRAVALNSLGVNIARAIGPAVGGALIATLGVAAAYFADVLSYALIILALWWWKPEPQPAREPEQMVEAMRGGIRFALFHPDLRRVLLRAFLFFIAASWGNTCRELPGNMRRRPCTRQIWTSVGYGER